MDKIVIITGANSGIGKAAALKFASVGCHVIMACRNMGISSIVQQEIVAATKNTSVDLMQLDVSSFESIRSFCSVFNATYPHLDILIHNAAYLNHGEKQYKLNADGYELSFATNVWGPLLMTHLLQDKLSSSADPIVLHACTTNIKHFFDPKRKIEFDNLRGEYRNARPYSTYKMYGDSKMALLMLSFQLAEELSTKGIKVNALQINNVKLSKETIKKMHSIWRYAAIVQNIINPPTSVMADNYFHICTSEQLNSVTGKLFNHKREIMHPSITETGFTQLNNILGVNYYPNYAINPRYADQLQEISKQIITSHAY